MRKKMNLGKTGHRVEDLEAEMAEGVRREGGGIELEREQELLPARKLLLVPLRPVGELCLLLQTSTAQHQSSLYVQP